MLEASDYGAFTLAVWGHRPYPWQQALADQVLEEGRWPAVLDLPTGSGKTATLDIALFTLAVAAQAGSARLPRRVAFVVDRRVVVDQATERARALAAALDPPEAFGGEAGAEGEQVRQTVRQSLMDLGGSRPLRVSVQRGGIPRDDAWAGRPDQPTILLSTVDQVGSRLLFRGYGVSARMQPVHAGLLGEDTLFLLDEVHLSRPFADTLARVDALRGGSPDGVGRSWQVVQMSATPGQGHGEPFRLSGADRDAETTPRLAQCLGARKEARLVDVRGRGEPHDVLPGAVVKELKELSGKTVAVVVNRVRTAQRIFEELDGEHTAVLLTGRMRGFDRDDVYEQHRGRIVAGRTRSEDDNRLVVVATQSIEAGADLDFDAMVTECAPIDSLRQRFGRLDRRGELAAAAAPAQAVILAPKAARGRDPDPVYGEAINEAYDFLRGRFGKDAFDVGPESTAFDGALAEAFAPSREGPMLLPTHVDVLVQTWPRPLIDPPVASWLHGFETPDIDVNVVWRADLTEADLEAQRRGEQTSGVRDDGAVAAATEVVAVAPPAAPEVLPVPMGAVRAWLRHDAEAPVADVEGQYLGEDVGTSQRGGLALRWRGGSDSKVVQAHELRPGDTLVVPAARGGVRAGNWAPDSTDAVTDFGDRAQLVQRGKAVLRLDESVLPNGFRPPADLTPEIDRDELHERIGAWLDDVSEKAAARGPDWFADIVRHLAASHPRRVSHHWTGGATGTVRLVLTTKVPAGDTAVDVDDLDGSDLTNSFTGVPGAVELDDHLRGVGALAAELGRRCFLGEDLVEDLCLAGELHDLGKADSRFQRWLHGGDEVATLAAAVPLAKSTYDSSRPAERERARRASGYPTGARHELLSAALVENAPEALGRAHDPDLVLHLITSHHGYCRPLAPVVDDPNPRDVTVQSGGVALQVSSDHGLEAVDAGIAHRFWQLVRRYGWWRLAHLEAVLRLADHRRSQLETEGGS